MRLGDLDNVVDFIQSYMVGRIAKSELLWALSQQPTIDAVPVVRCKDCKHSFEDDFDGSLWCCRDKDREVVETHFCSYGQRKDGDSDA